MHPIRIVLLAGAAITVLGTLMPWLVGVPEDTLSIGDGTILGITTLHGVLVVVAMAGVAAGALTAPPRTSWPSRWRCVGALVLAVLALMISSLVIGTTKQDVYDEIDAIAPTRELADRMIVAVSKKLDALDMGFGAYFVVAGLAVIALAAIAGAVAPRRRRESRK